MTWSWRIGRIAGISVYIHFTFLLLLGWIVLARYSLEGDITAALQEMGFVVIVFGIIVLHELGHALAARRYGIQTRDITLYPIGGVARLERMPEDPKQELVVALAGPAVNVVLAAALFGWMWVSPEVYEIHPGLLLGGQLLPRLFVINVMLVLFNMIPAFPMDGGRVLRALLALRMDYLRATQIAASIGQGIALLFGFIGLFANPFLIFVALFVWIGAAQEASMVQIRWALGGIPVSRAMIRDFRTLKPNDSLGVAVEHILAGFQQDFPVVEDGKVVGVLTRPDLITALSKQGEEGIVGEVMQRDFQTAEPAEMLDSVFARLQNCECRSLPVVRNGQLVGLITLDNVGEFVMIQSALRSANPNVPEDFI
ncbi:MAG TPA: site-2 protease family protein [Gemmataceae bacterium]|nr:site-2 protease family protein [Gemmataceae bacterium]